MRLVDFSESSLITDLQDLDLAAKYLEDVLSQGSIESFLHAIRNVAIANGGIQKLSENTKLGRESMYKALSRSGNPLFSTVHKILAEMGFRLSVATAVLDR